MSAQDIVRQRSAVYKIRDADGQLVAMHHRIGNGDGKRMLWKLADGTWGLNGTPLADLPLYGSEQVSEWDEDELIVVVEGEKARDSLAHTGYFNVLGTVTGASGTPGKVALKVLRGKRVVLWADNDHAGRSHMQRIAESLDGVAEEIIMFTWHEAPEKGDAADHPTVQRGDEKALDRLLQDLEDAPRWKPPDRNVVLSNTFTAAELMAEELSPVRWVIPEILPEGVTLLVGKPKLGKSWMALGFGIAVATGGAALGTKRVQQGSCLYLALEDNRRRLQKRLKKLLASSVAADDLHISTAWPRLDEGGAEALEDWLQKYPGARAIFIDTLAKVRPLSRRQDIYAEDYAALEKLLPLAAEYGVAIVVVHHSRKMGAADPLDEISGSTGLSGGVDGVLILKRDRSKADAYLYVTGRDVEEDAEYALRWDQKSAAWTLVGDADEYRQSEERRTILKLLESTGPLAPKDVAEALGKNANTTRGLLRKMLADGQVAVEEGRYKAVNTVNGVNNTSEGEEAVYGVYNVLAEDEEDSGMDI